MSDTDDLNDIIDETPAEETPVEPEQPEEPQPEEPVVQAEPAELAQPAEPAAPPMVPQAVIGEVRAENRALKKQLEQLGQMVQSQQPEPQAPDFYENPEAAVQHHIQPVHKALEAQKMQMSRFTAEQQFGPELVQQAYDYFEANPQASQALMGHPSPFHAAVQEYQKAQIANEVGNDPAAYREKIRAEVEREIRREMEAKQTAAAVAQAPSMAAETSIGGRVAPAPTLTSLDDILGS